MIVCKHKTLGYVEVVEKGYFTVIVICKGGFEHIAQTIDICEKDTDFINHFPTEKDNVINIL